MSTRTNGKVCWYCNSEPNEPCEACDEVNELDAKVANLEGLMSHSRAWKIVAAVFAKPDSDILQSHDAVSLLDYLRSIR